MHLSYKVSVSRCSEGTWKAGAPSAPCTQRLFFSRSPCGFHTHLFIESSITRLGSGLVQWLGLVGTTSVIFRQRIRPQDRRSIMMEASGEHTNWNFTEALFVNHSLHMIIIPKLLAGFAFSFLPSVLPSCMVSRALSTLNVL